MARNATESVLSQHWVHSHEEDTATEMVFRPAAYNFPRSRGRKSFELKPDGSLLEIGIAPTDRQQESHGTWVWHDDDTLAFYASPGAESRRVMHIASVDKDQLPTFKGAG